MNERTEKRLIELIAKGGMVVLVLVLGIGLMCATVEAMRDFIKFKKWKKDYVPEVR